MNKRERELRVKSPIAEGFTQKYKDFPDTHTHRLWSVKGKKSKEEQTRTNSMSSTNLQMRKLRYKQAKSTAWKEQGQE